MATVKNPTSGRTVQLAPNGGNVYWSFSIDSNLRCNYRLNHTDSATGNFTLISSGDRPAAVHVDFSVANLIDDELEWFILCNKMNPGKWPVYVQLFQGSPPNPVSITPVYEYTADVSTNASATISDRIVFA